MSILTQEDRKDLVWAVRKSLLESVRSGVLTEGKKAAAENFIINEATYEQLLNMAFNPERETNYKSASVLEKVALESYSSFLEEKKEEKEEKKGSTAGKIAKGAAIGGAAGWVAGGIRRVTSKGYDKAHLDFAEKARKHSDELMDKGVNWKNSKEYIKKIRALPEYKTANALKYGGKWGRIGLGVGAAGTAAAIALKKRREKKAAKNESY